ncbi:class II fructose-bisphosphate aldolase [Enterococcus sp. ALS3]|uniref:Class II fructose-bisphosphate aldolase n=1 Tax=Enterococcus alishanensis TaxID=1303817 RepID=A0ABS6TA26_9ENTE|nr:class II fructose-bisphosphate aldolase [Enterococcus alishanensis]MBV7389749.1 class II fructose-bisphosphate aldolase [Enterococcus alishanensis]
MVLANLKDVLTKANEEKYAVGAFNVTDLNTARGIVAAAEELHSPVILQFAEVHDEYISIETVANMYLHLAKQSSVPVVVHLDHGVNFETIMKAVKLGFSSVMVDTSTLPLKENIAKVQEVVKIAHCLGLTVEGELGVMNAEDGSGRLDYNEMTDSFTNPDEAKIFVEETQVDALAIAFGTVHGLYRGKPNLNFDRIKEIKEQVGIPLVMHGGSGLSDEEYRQSIANGINKINYYSTMAYDVTNKLRTFLQENEEAYLTDIDVQVQNFVKENIMEKIEVFGSAGKA